MGKRKKERKKEKNWTQKKGKEKLKKKKELELANIWLQVFFHHNNVRDHTEIIGVVRGGDFNSSERRKEKVLK